MDFQLLSDYYMMYAKNEFSLEQLTNILHEYTYNFPRYIGFHRLDACGDFWSKIERRIPKYIQSFSYNGVPFGQYMNYVLKFQLISFIKENTERQKRQQMFEDKNAVTTLYQKLYHNEDNTYFDSNVQVSENSTTYHIDDLLAQYDAESKNFITMTEFLNAHSKKRTDKRRLWLFVLSHSPLIPISRIYEIAKHLNISKNECQHTLKALESDILYQQKRKQLLEEKCNSCFSRKSMYEHRLEQSILSKQEKEQNEKMREIYTNRFFSYFEKLQKLSFTVSHAKIAATLGIPKGTVNSNIALLMKRCKSLAKHSREQGLI